MTFAASCGQPAGVRQVGRVDFASERSPVAYGIAAVSAAKAAAATARGGEAVAAASPCKAATATAAARRQAFGPFGRHDSAAGRRTKRP